MILFLLPLFLFLEPFLLASILKRFEIKAKPVDMFALLLPIWFLRFIALGCLLNQGFFGMIIEDTYIRSSLDAGHEPLLLDFLQTTLPALIIFPAHALILIKMLRSDPKKILLALLISTLIATFCYAVFLTSLSNGCFAVGGC